MKKLIVGLCASVFASIAVEAGQLEYVESTGAQYFDTGVVPKSGTTMRMSFAFTKTSVGKQSMGWAANNKDKKEYFRFGCEQTAGKLFVCVNTTGTYREPSTPVPDIGKHTVELRGGLQAIDGVQVATDAFADTASATDTLWLFGEHQEWTASGTTCYCHVRIYSCEIYEAEKLVRFYVPWKDDNGAVGFRDLANGGSFSAATSGTLTPGPDLEVKRFSYVESNGTQWFETGVRADSNTCLSVDFSFTERTGSKQTMGWASSGGKESFRFGCDNESGKFFVNASDNNAYTSFGAVDMVRHSVELRSGSQKFDSVAKASATYGKDQFPDGGQTLWLFAEHGEFGDGLKARPTSFCKARIYSCRIFQKSDEGFELVRNFIPASAAGWTGFYDEVDGVFIPSSGGVALTCGPERPQVSLVPYVEATGQEWIDTGIVPRSDTRITFKFSYLGNAGQQYSGWGSDGSKEALQFGTHDGTKFNYRYSPTTETTDTGITFDYEQHEFDLGPGLQKFDGTECSYNTLSDTAEAGQTIYLFARHAEWLDTAVKAGRSGAVECHMYAKMRMYECRIWSGGILVRDYRPCLANGRVGLYEAVSGDVVYSKTGVDFKHPIAEDVKVTRLEYVDTDGHQWMESGVHPTHKTRVFADLMFLSDGANQFFGWGSGSSGFTYEFGVHEGRYGWSVNAGTAYDLFENLDVGQRVKYDVRSGSQKLNGVVRTANILERDYLSTGKGYERTLFLLARKGLGNEANDKVPSTADTSKTVDCLRGIPPDQFCTARFYGCKIWEDGELIRDYIPAQIGGQVGVFDQVNRVFHTGATAHPYVAGPTKMKGLIVVFK